MQSRQFVTLMLTLFVTSTVVTEVSFGFDDWPQWRGPRRDGISTDTGLLKEWPTEGPAVLWQIETVGVGYSSLVIKDGRIYTQGDLDGVEHVLCHNAKTGKRIWAVQPEPLKQQLDERVAAEAKNLDTNKDGRIDEVEALKRLGFDFNKFDKKADVDVEEFADARTQRLFAALDANKDQRLSEQEAGRPFHREFERIDKEENSVDAEELAKRRTKEWMASYDKNGDGMIDREESRAGIVDRYFGGMDERDKATNAGDEQLTVAEIETYLQKREPGKDGVISFDEMRAYYVSKYPAQDGFLSAEELRGYFGGYRNGMGDGPRGTPTVDGNRVYSEGGNGDVTCMDAATGETIWHVNLSADFGGDRPGWGYSESPLVDGEMLFVTPGGKQGTVLALDKQTGKKIWQSDEVTEGAHYSTPVIAEIHGKRTLVQFARESVFGVTPDTGRFLWKYGNAANGTANCATPIIDDNHVFASSAYGTGGGLAKIRQTGGEQTAEEVYFEKKMGNHHGGIVKSGEYMYGFGSGLICMDFKTGKIAWQDRSVGKGSLTVADGMLYLLSENNEIALAEATPDGYREHGRFKYQGHGRPSWAHPVVTGGVLYIRDQEFLTAYNVRP
jgi:outer membrane protein assembly factor BamB/Ca2+-binding EF-hand superfamily protein